MPVISGGAGGNTTAQVTASGKVVPVAAPAGATVDSTTYADTIRGGGAKLTTLVLSARGGALAIAIAGDAFPRWVFEADPGDGIYFADGTIDPVNNGNAANIDFLGAGLGIGVGGAYTPGAAPALAQLSPFKTILSGALPTVQLVTATGAQISTARDAETITPCTFNPGAATTATVTVALSPDNVTYSTLAVVTEPAGVALDGTILPINVRVPAGWYLKLTVNAQAVLGLTTWY